MGGRPPTQSGDTASTLILIGLILQIIEVVVLFVLGLILLIVPLIGVFVVLIGTVGIVWVALVYIFSYRPTSAGDYDSAQTPTLVFGILSLLTLGLISGILYIIAYAKLGDAAREAASVPPGWGAPAFGVGWRYCTACGRPNPLTSAYCQFCGTRLSAMPYA